MVELLTEGLGQLVTQKSIRPGDPTLEHPLERGVAERGAPDRTDLFVQRRPMFGQVSDPFKARARRRWRQEQVRGCLLYTSISGRQIIHMDDGTELEIGAGDIVSIPAGHDGWTVGDEPCVVLDFAGMALSLIHISLRV